MKALVVSLKFNPGHFSHLVANYRLFEQLGYSPYLFINPAFNKMDVGNNFNKISNLKELNDSDINVAVFWFPSLKNILEIIRLRLLYKSKIIYVYHEPFDSVRNYFKAGFGILKIIRIALIHMVNLLILLLSDKILLPSSAAFDVYESKYKRLNSNYTLLPLLFDDESLGDESLTNKKFISYIGTVAADHAFNRFVDFSIEAMNNGWFKDKIFLIATSSVIPERERELLQPFIDMGKIFIHEGSAMSNETINAFYRDSIVVWNAYNRSMQSGVLPKAYMFGAAVVVLKRNASSFVEHLETGILINDNADMGELRAAVELIISKQVVFREKCRIKFMNTFFYKKYLDIFKGVLTFK